MKNTKNIIDLISVYVVIIVITCVPRIALKSMNYFSTLKTPASVYEIGEIVEDEYQIVGTDNKNTLWLKKPDEDCTYVAIVSSDFPNLTSLHEKFKWILNTSLKDSVNIEITDQIKGPPDTDKS